MIKSQYGWDGYPRFKLPGIVDFCSALLPPEHGGPDPKLLGELVEKYASCLPTPARHGLRVAIGAITAGTYGKLRSSDPDTRVKALNRLQGFGGGQALDAVKTIVLLVSGSDRNAQDILTRSNINPPARPDPHLDITPSLEWSSISYFDAVVIGSGAGGAMVARSLARSGMNVVVVEEGARHSVEEFRSHHPLRRWADLYRDAGATAALGIPPIVLPIGRGVGGTTLVNSGTCYRPPTKVLKRWRDESHLELADPDFLNPLVDDVWRTLEIGPVDLSVMGNNGLTALAGAKELGWAHGPLNRNAPGCGGCCQCAIGCPRNAKFGVHLNALPQACEAGAKILSHARVTKILTEGGRATGILASRENGSHLEIRAPIVVVCAGATETPPLLRRSHLGHHPRLGKNLALHPAIGISGRFSQDITAWQGVLQSASVEEFHDSDGILIEATSTPPGMGSMILPGFGQSLIDEISRSNTLCTLGAMIGDDGSGTVVGSRSPIITYNLKRHDGARLVKSIWVMGKVLFASGAHEVLTGIPSHQVVKSVAELEEATSNANYKKLHVAAFHPTGTCAGGGDPSTHPADPYGSLRGVMGVWIADASLIPSCPEVNPQVSIMALAQGVAIKILDNA